MARPAADPAADRPEAALDGAGLFPNQSMVYHDIRALRRADWSPDDCWRRVDERPAFMSRAAWMDDGGRAIGSATSAEAGAT